MGQDEKSAKRLGENEGEKPETHGRSLRVGSGGSSSTRDGSRGGPRLSPGEAVAGGGKVGLELGESRGVVGDAEITKIVRIVVGRLDLLVLEVHDETQAGELVEHGEVGHAVRDPVEANG